MPRAGRESLQEISLLNLALALSFRAKREILLLEYRTRPITTRFLPAVEMTAEWAESSSENTQTSGAIRCARGLQQDAAGVRYPLQVGRRHGGGEARLDINNEEQAVGGATQHCVSAVPCSN